MRPIVLWVVVLAAAWGGYEGWAHYQRSLGKLEAAIADDVTVRTIERAKDAVLVVTISTLRDSAVRAANRAVLVERRRGAAVLASDSAAVHTDSVLHVAMGHASDSTTRQLLDSVASVVATERAVRTRERFASDSTIGAWKLDAAFWHRAADSTGALATSRLRQIAALDAQNQKIRALIPSKTGSALKTAGAIVLTVIACRQVHC